MSAEQPPQRKEGESGAARLLTALRNALTAARAIPLTAYEELTGDELLPLVTAVRAALDGALAVLALAVRRYDSPGRGSRESIENNLLLEVDRRMEDPSSAEKIAGLAFVAQFALRAHISTLSGTSLQGESWEVIGACGAAIREVHKSLAALDVSVCELERIPVAESFYISELDRSLNVRRAYVAFRKDLTIHEAPDVGSIFVRLRRVGTAIAKLIGREIYPSARVHDRWMIRKLQKRVRDWLSQSAKGGGGDALTLAGMRLWEEVVNVAELFLQVNNRAELREYDLAQIDAAVTRATTGTHAGADEPLQLSPLWGRDPGLDNFLEGRVEFAPIPWLVALRHARGRLAASPPPGGALEGYGPRRSPSRTSITAVTPDTHNPDDTF